MRAGLLLASLAMLGTGAAAAQSALSIKRSVYLETRSEAGTSLSPAKTIKSGDRLVMVMQWPGTEAPRSFTLASKVPSTVLYQRSSRDGAEVSVDGGRKWGRLGQLSVGERLAAPEDVTNVRWRIATAKRPGTLSYSAIVR